MEGYSVSKLEIGQQYLAIEPAYSFELAGEIVTFEEKRLEIEVIEKPEFVEVIDGAEQREEKLPKHLLCDEWHNVRNLQTGKVQWLNSEIYKINLLTDGFPSNEIK